ncbi:SDR family NAD(P)-dependent oxidoreductase [Micromonospora sp. HM5-17]|jgi:NAD(P)-dependent dehydrogenase (short-subunit alcohol dehydrogenase family)|uniref:SDR family NAD(P)-dependent oxidoreductase n=1 Tax=Micromonospora sp. HM5-17 TaxID=2487710 RepID=UPI000F4671C6|nr:SDR family NAD(P)-dependent oxidoreductase [Micromonospora sp. HM5-17]ROT32415.1 SDR family NAD(P)-dependent oxidoreductase [Micromonospora sp. HM5-17]
MVDRTVLVTGGTGGLGSAVTAAFQEAGWRVVVPARPTAPDRAPAAAAAEPHTAPATAGVEPVRVVADLTDPGQVARAVEVAAADADAPLRAVVNLVGGYAAGGRIHETPLADFEQMITLNLRPTYLVTQQALPYLVEAGGGAIVCVSSRAALSPFPGAAGYVTAKAAVLAFASAVAVEYRESGIRCNTVVPSVIDTPANRAAQPTADHSRWVAPAEIARVIRFLASEDSAPTSGATVPVYGRA